MSDEFNRPVSYEKAINILNNVLQKIFWARDYALELQIESAIRREDVPNLLKAVDMGVIDLEGKYLSFLNRIYAEAPDYVHVVDKMAKKIQD